MKTFNEFHESWSPQTSSSPTPDIFQKRINNSLEYIKNIRGKQLDAPDLYKVINYIENTLSGYRDSHI